MAVEPDVTTEKGERRWWGRFFQALAETGIVTQAAHAAGINRLTAYRHRASNPEFAKRWEEAEQRGIDMLEDVARKRAMQSSDTLLIFLLKHKRPNVYNPPVRSQVEMDVAALSDDELRQRIAELEGTVLSTAAGKETVGE
jgi:hypothetical protein